MVREIFWPSPVCFSRYIYIYDLFFFFFFFFISSSSSSSSCSVSYSTSFSSFLLFFFSLCSWGQFICEIWGCATVSPPCRSWPSVWWYVSCSSTGWGESNCSFLETPNLATHVYTRCGKSFLWLTELYSKGMRHPGKHTTQVYIRCGNPLASHWVDCLACGESQIYFAVIHDTKLSGIKIDPWSNTVCNFIYSFVKNRKCSTWCGKELNKQINQSKEYMHGHSLIH